MGKMHVKTGDTVIVIAGKEKGKKGKIIAAYPKKDRVVVEGLNLVKRHTKPSQNNPQGGIISPLLANIYLNGIDWMIAKEYEFHPYADLRFISRMTFFVPFMTLA